MVQELIVMARALTGRKFFSVQSPWGNFGRIRQGQPTRRMQPPSHQRLCPRWPSFISPLSRSLDCLGIRLLVPAEVHRATIYADGVIEMKGVLMEVLIWPLVACVLGTRQDFQLSTKRSTNVNCISTAFLSLSPHLSNVPTR